MNTTIFPVYQSIKDTVKTTGLSEFYLRKLLKDNKLPHLKSGTKVMVNVPSLIESLESKSAIAPTVDKGGVVNER